MAITITTVSGNAVISADGANPGLIITPTGEVQVGVDTAVSIANPNQLVTAQNVIDYVQQGGLPAALTASSATPTYDLTVYNIPATARRITVTVDDVQLQTASRALYCTMKPVGGGATGGSDQQGTVTLVGSSSVSWATFAYLPVTTASTAVGAYCRGVVVFERASESVIPYTFTGPGATYWSVTSQVSYITSGGVASQFISSGYIIQVVNQGNTDIESYFIRVDQGGAPVTGGMSVVVES